MGLFDVKYKCNNILFTIYCIKLQKFQILNVLLKNGMDEWKENFWNAQDG